MVQVNDQSISFHAVTYAEGAYADQRSHSGKVQLTCGIWWLLNAYAASRRSPDRSRDPGKPCVKLSHPVTTPWPHVES